jgi:phosphatidylglycerophosphatase GEP4
MTDSPTNEQAESVSHNLSVPVLTHNSLKPSNQCIKSITSYFSSLPTPIPTSKLIVVGDRLLTDILMANSKEMRSLGVWTTKVWGRKYGVLRWWERWVLERVIRRRAASGVVESREFEAFVKVDPAMTEKVESDSRSSDSARDRAYTFWK